MKVEFWSSILLVRKQYAAVIEQVSQRYGLTRAEMDVLLFLGNNPQLDRATDIVEMRGLTKSHVSIAVRGLCQRGYLVAAHDPQDRRVIRLKPTEKAEPAICQGQQAQDRFFEILFADFSEEDWVHWMDLQKKLQQNVRNAPER